MPSLDDHGKLAAAVIPFYLPILAISFMLVLRHGFRRESGWIFIFIFSIGAFALALTIDFLRLILVLFSPRPRRNIANSGTIGTTSKYQSVCCCCYPRSCWFVALAACHTRFCADCVRPHNFLVLELALIKNFQWKKSVWREYAFHPWLSTARNPRRSCPHPFHCWWY